MATDKITEDSGEELKRAFCALGPRQYFRYMYWVHELLPFMQILS